MNEKFTEFNINDTVYVRLTDYGRKCLRLDYDKLEARCGGKLGFSYTPPKEDEDGWSKWQMWHLMEHLGPHITLCMDPPFETIIRLKT